MPKPQYNPFGKPTFEVKLADLVALRDVAEGWYIEYKREVPSARSVAKSISSLANTYGGWLFYGIDGAKDRTADLFPGVPVQNLPLLEMQIRQAASSSISPPPYFETFTLSGPDKELGIADNAAIIIVHVPLSYAAPHVHRDGRIYRRVADESDPRPETDRHFLDLLWQRGKDRDVSLETLFSYEPAGDEGGSCLELFLLPRPWLERWPDHFVTFAEFADLMKDPNPETGGIPFDNLYSNVDGFVARQVFRNNPEGVPLTWRYRWDGASHISVPFNSSGITNPDREFVLGYKYALAFQQRCVADKFSLASIIDLNSVYFGLLAIMTRHEHLTSLGKLRFPYELKLRFRRVGRCVPFIDTSGFHELVSKFGIPYSDTKSVSWPPTTTFELIDKTEEQTITDWTYSKAELIFSVVCQTFGIPSDLINDPSWTEEILSSFERFKTNQANRNARE